LIRKVIRQPLASKSAWISSATVGAAAQLIEAIVKPPTPTISIRLRPKMSPRRPPASSATARLIVNAVVIR
jgi:hypothetical protein